MDRKSSLDLALELAQHQWLTPAEDFKLYFFSIFDPSEVNPGRFYGNVVDNQYRMHDQSTNRTRAVRIKRILRNETARYFMEEAYKRGGASRLWTDISTLALFEKDAVARNLRREPQILEMMVNAYESRTNYSAFGEIETVDWNPEKVELGTRAEIPHHKMVAWKMANIPNDIIKAMANVNGNPPKVETRPLICIPSGDTGKLLEWESENTRYGLIDASGSRIKITREQYRGF